MLSDKQIWQMFVFWLDCLEWPLSQPQTFPNFLSLAVLYWFPISKSIACRAGLTCWLDVFWHHLFLLWRILLAELERHQDAWPFLTPVNLKSVPGYRKVIKKPMDFSTIREKLVSSQWVSITSSVLVMATFSDSVLPKWINVWIFWFLWFTSRSVILKGLQVEENHRIIMNSCGRFA